LKSETIQRLKKNNLLVIDKVNYMNVCSELMYDTSFVRLLRLFIYALFYSHKISSLSNKNSKVIILYSLAEKKRCDYDEIVTNLSNCLGYDGAHCKIKLKFNILMPFMLLLSSKRIQIFQLMRAIGFFEGILLSLLVANYRSHASYIGVTLKNTKCKTLYTFCDALPIENLISQIANNLNMTTLTLQHGQYAYNNLIGVSSANDESYLNFVSKYICVWGKATADEFIKAGIAEERILITGSLRNYALNNKRVLKYSGKLEARRFGLILSSDSNMNDNIEMILLANKISEKYGFTYIVRCHPNNDLGIYNKYFGINISEIVSQVESFEYFDMVDFSLMYMTGVFNEAIAYRARFFIFSNKGLLGLYSDLDITVASLAEFEIKYKAILCADSSLEVYDNLHNYFNNSVDICGKYRSTVSNLVL